MDDGGLGVEHAAGWIGEGLSRLNAVLAGEIELADWGREDWGAQFSADEVTVYSMYDESVSRALNTPVFRLALIAWRDFIQQVPNEGDRVEIAI
jgi:hypothetical protein